MEGEGLCPQEVRIAGTLRSSGLQLCHDIRSGALGHRDAQRKYILSANLIQMWLTQFDREGLITGPKPAPSDGVRSDRTSAQHVLLPRQRSRRRPERPAGGAFHREHPGRIPGLRQAPRDTRAESSWFPHQPLAHRDSPIFPNLYRNVISSRPDLVWVADFTYIRVSAKSNASGDHPSLLLPRTPEQRLQTISKPVLEHLQCSVLGSRKPRITSSTSRSNSCAHASRCKA